MTADFGYPVTPHLAGSCGTAEDVFGAESDTARVLAGCTVVHEKLDGLNVGFRTGEDGRFRAAVLKDRAPRPAEHGATARLAAEFAARQQRSGTPSGRLQIYGELVDPAVPRLDRWHVFDVFDETAGRFWSSSRVDDLARGLGLQRVPCVARGPLPDLEAVRALVAGPGWREGVVLRVEAGPWLLERYKFVRSGFVKREWGLA